VTPDDGSTSGTRRRGSAALAVLAVVLVSVNLRPGATSVGPVLAEIRRALGMSAGTAGVMTALPGLCFAVVGAVAVALARRIGTTGGIAAGLVAVTVCLALRVLTGNIAVFLVLTTLALAGMAIGNVLVPAWIKRHSTDGGVRLMTIYGTGLTVGGSAGSLVSAPVTGGAPGGWRTALVIWAAGAGCAVLPWAVLARREHTDPADHRAPITPPSGSMTRSRIAVALTAYFGVQSMNAYVQFGWLPQIYRDAGLSAVTAGELLAWVAGLGVFGGLLMPGFVARSANLSWAVCLLGGLMALGYLGLWWAPARYPWVWATLLGVAGWTFPAAIALITARTRDPQVTAQLSGFVQPIGYLLAAAGPFLVGLVHSWTGGWGVVLGLLMLSSVAMTAAGLMVARPGSVDDELVRRAAR
jgi:CP family cyanate transporter-like MFS transporter